MSYIGFMSYTPSASDRVPGLYVPPVDALADVRLTIDVTGEGDFVSRPWDFMSHSPKCFD